MTIVFSGRIFLLGVAGLALTACSFHDLFAPEFGPKAQRDQGHYQHAAKQNHQSHPAQHQQAAYAGSHYQHSGPIHDVAPYSYSVAQSTPQGHYASHDEASHYQAPHYNAGHGMPSLRGAHHPRGYDIYANLGGIKYDVDEKPYGVVGRIGVQKGYIGAEVEATTGVTNQDEIDLDYSVAAFGVLRAPVTEQLNLLGRVGYNTANIEDQFHVDGVAYGAGVEYNFNRQNGLRVDYTRYDIEDFGNADSVSVAYLRRF